MPSLSVELLNCPDFTYIIITLIFGLTQTVVKVWSWSLCRLPHSCLARFLAVGIKWVLWRLRAPQSHSNLQILPRFTETTEIMSAYLQWTFLYDRDVARYLHCVSTLILLSVVYFVLTLIVQDLHGVLNLTCSLVHLKMTTTTFKCHASCPICNLSSNIKFFFSDNGNWKWTDIKECINKSKDNKLQINVLL